MDVKPLDIVEPEIIGKTSLTTKSSTTNSLPNKSLSDIKNDFNVSYSDMQSPNETKLKKEKSYSVSELTPQKTKPEKPNQNYLTPQKQILNKNKKFVQKVNPANYKTIFQSKLITNDILNNNEEEVKITWNKIGRAHV